MKRILFLLLLLGSLIGLGVYVIDQKKNNATKPSLEGLFTLFGKSTKAVDRSITKALHVTNEDEAEYGAMIAQHYQFSTNTFVKERVYLQKLVDEMTKQANPKDLTWKVFVLDGPPNAYALPGGVIVVFKGLLDLVQDEAELMSILAHEKGHVDLGHCMDGFRLTIKAKNIPLPDLLNLITQGLWHLSFSKYQEKEADDYAFNMLRALHYDLFALSRAFQHLKKWSISHGASKKDPRGIGAYFTTHPALDVRIENAYEKAKRFSSPSLEHTGYIGRANLQNRVTRDEHRYEGEEGDAQAGK
ncbi:MAG: M48 family metallopeptidase [Candidatus Nucleicultricaceae bacterium]